MGLSAPDYNNYERILKYKSTLDYRSTESELQDRTLQHGLQPELQYKELELPSPTKANEHEKIVSQLHQKQKRLNDDEVEQIIVGYKSGLSMNELARKFDCHKTTISQKLKTAGVTIRRLPPSDNQIAKIVELYQSGLSLEKVGDTVDASASSVKKYLREQGVETRGPHERVK